MLRFASILVLSVTLASCNEGPVELEGESEVEGECGPAPVVRECEGGELQVGDVCVRPPSEETVRTACGEITDNCDEGGDTTPDLACHDAEPALPDGPATVTLTGFVDVFGNGPDGDRVRVQIFDAERLDAAICQARADGALTAGWIVETEFDAETLYGEQIVYLGWENHDAPPPGCRACPSEDKARDGIACDLPRDDCSPACDLDAGEYCGLDENGEARCLERLRWECRYAIPDVPTNRYLAIRTAGEDELDDQTWSPMVQYNTFLFADSPHLEGGAYELKINVLSVADYASIPNTVIGTPVPAGHGAVAGEVRDCQDKRLSNAQVGVFPAPEAYTFFNGNPVDTLPALARLDLGTNRDGIYAALDVDPGRIEVAAVVLRQGAPLVVGDVSASVLPDSVTVVGFAENKPPQ